MPNGDPGKDFSIALMIDSYNTMMFYDQDREVA